MNSTTSGQIAVQVSPSERVRGRDVAATGLSLLVSAYHATGSTVGLLNGKTVTVSTYRNGSVLHRASDGLVSGGGIRGEISGFSREAQRRLKEELIGLDLADNYFWMTLTYPGEWSRDWREWKGNLEAFKKALERRYAGRFGGAVWKLERQKRGAPHFHLLLHWLNGEALGDLRTWTRETWTRILGGPPAGANWVHTHVVRVEIQPDGAEVKLLGYLVKYLGKVDEAGWFDPATGERLMTGRIWGHWGELPRGVPEVVEVSGYDCVQLARRVRLWGRRSPYLRSVTAEKLSGIFYGRWVNKLLRGLDGVESARAR